MSKKDVPIVGCCACTLTRIDLWKEDIETAAWMDGDTRGKAKAKLDQVTRCHSPRTMCQNLRVVYAVISAAPAATVKANACTRLHAVCCGLGGACSSGWVEGARGDRFRSASLLWSTQQR
eukprot:3921000-Rhodomonas_salina.5